MAGRARNEVVLTFAGDNAQLQKAMKEVGESADRMSDEVGQASRRMNEDVDRTAQAFDNAAEATDTLDTRAMGFRDTITGVTDTVQGFGDILRGDLSADALFTAGAGVGDLASGFTNLLIPALKSARANIMRAKDATLAFISTAKGATLALGGVGLALTAAFLLFQAFRKSTEDAEVSVDNLVTDLERFEETGRVTGEIVKILGDDASDLKGRLEALDPTLRENRSGWDKFLDTFRVTHTEADILKDELSELDEGLARFVEAGGDGEQVLQDLARHYGLNAAELEHVIDAMPRFRDELERAEEKQRDAEDAVLAHMDSLKALGDVLKAQTDPVFAFVQAQRRLEDAQRAVTEAADEFGENSPEHEQALLDLAAAELGLTSAAGDAEEAIDGALLPTLEKMRDDGLLSEGAFRALEKAIEDAGDEARRQDGTRVEITTVHTVIQRVEQAFAGATEFFGVDAPRRRHTGGVVPGHPGQETLAILQAGERVIPAGQAGAGVTVTVQAGRGGSTVEQTMSDLVLHLVRTGALSLSVDSGGRVSV